MGATISDDLSSESTHQIHSKKIIHVPREGLYQFMATFFAV